MQRENTKSVGAVVLNKESKVLLVFRADLHFWEFPKGKQKEGESDEETLRRELKEEIGIAEYGFIKPFFEEIYYSFRLGDKIIDRTVAYYLIRIHDEVKISDEHTEMGWYTISRAKEKVRFDNYRQVLDKVRETLEKSDA